MTAPGRFILILEPSPAGKDQHGRDPAYRLRGLLKIALRSFGLRCVDVRPADPATPSPATDHGGHDA